MKYKYEGRVEVAFRNIKDVVLSQCLLRQYKIRCYLGCNSFLLEQLKRYCSCFNPADKIALSFSLLKKREERVLYWYVGTYIIFLGMVHNENHHQYISVHFSEGVSYKIFNLVQFPPPYRLSLHARRERENFSSSSS